MLTIAFLFRISLGVGINVELCMGRYGASVMRKSTTKSTIQFDPLLLKFSMDDINSLAIPSMLMLAVSDRMCENALSSVEIDRRSWCDRIARPLWRRI